LWSLLGVPSNPGVCPILSSRATLRISVPTVPASECGLLGPPGGPPGGPLGGPSGLRGLGRGSSAGSSFLAQISPRNS
jgi:hypothetical protein